MNEEEKKAIEILKDNIGILEGKLTIKYTNYNTVKAYNTILNLIEKLQKENEELKDKIREHTLLISPYYVKENFIPVQIIEDFIKKYQKLGDEFYEKFLETNRTDKDLHDVGLACDAKVQVLQELLEGRKNE